MSPRTLARTLLLASALVALAAPPAEAQDRDPDGETAMLDAINARRAAAGLAPLAREAHLEEAALRHSVEMAASDALEHVSATSGTPADRVHAAGLAIDDIGENVSMHATSAEAQAALEASAPHLANMTAAQFTHVGLAAVHDESGVYVTQVFGRIEAAPSAPSSPAMLTAPGVTAPEVVAPAATAPAAIAVPAAPTASAAEPTLRLDTGRAGASIGATLSVGPAPGAAVASTPALVPAPAVASAPAAAIAVPMPTGGASGYWVCATNRWWYYPIPAGAQAGQQLQPDPSVHGAPPGHAEGHCDTATVAVGPAPTYVAPAPAYVGPAYVGPTYVAPTYVAPRVPVIAPAWRAPSPVYAAPRAAYVPPPRTVYVAPRAPYAAPPRTVYVGPQRGGVVVGGPRGVVVGGRRPR